MFFEDARLALEILNFVAMVFADDLNAYKAFAHTADNEAVMLEIGASQRKLHEWGQANRVTFDAGKESMHVLSRTQPLGGNFKILGVNFDCKLVMEDAVHEVRAACSWKLETMLNQNASSTPAKL